MASIRVCGFISVSPVATVKLAIQGLRGAVIGEGFDEILQGLLDPGGLVLGEAQQRTQHLKQLARGVLTLALVGVLHHPNFSRQIGPMPRSMLTLLVRVRPQHEQDENFLPYSTALVSGSAAMSMSLARS